MVQQTPENGGAAQGDQNFPHPANLGQQLTPLEELNAQFAMDRMTNDYLALQVVGLVSRVMTLQEQTQDLQVRATRNPISHLYNKVGFRDNLEALRAAHPDTPIAVLLLDLANFKAVNDTLGHEFGDEVLRTVGSKLRGSDADNLVGHQGGDEFSIAALLEQRKIVIDPGQPASATQPPELTNEERMQAIIRRVQLVGVELNDDLPQLKGLGFSISVGGAILEPGMDVGEVSKQADAAMYVAKRAANQETLRALPLRRRLAHHIGSSLVKYSGFKASR